MRKQFSQSSILISMFGASTPFYLIAPPTPIPLVSSPFIGGRFLSQAFTPLNQVPPQQLSFHPCMHWKGLRMLSFIKSTKDFLLYILHKVSALSFIQEHFFSLHLLSHYSTLLDPTGTPAQSPCALVQFLFSRFLHIPCLCLTAAHPVTTPIQVKIGCQSLSPCCISLPLSGFSSILPSRNHSHRI